MVFENSWPNFTKALALGCAFGSEFEDAELSDPAIYRKFNEYQCISPIFYTFSNCFIIIDLIPKLDEVYAAKLSDSNI